MYDWANSAFVLVIITAVFPIYYQRVAAGGLNPDTATAWFGWATSIALAIVAVLSPVLGAWADFLAVRKRMMATAIVIGVLATGCLYFIGREDWIAALLLFSLGNIGLSVSFVFYDSLLPHIARDDEMDRVSSAGYAIGYLGSALLLMLNLWWIESPEAFGIADSGAATRLSFLSVAIWWGVFSIPMFRRVAEPPRVLEAGEAKLGSAVQGTLRRLRTTLADLHGAHRQALLALVAMFVYNDGIGTVIRMAAIYASAIGIPEQHVIIAILLVQLVGVPFSFLFGWLADRIGTRASLMIGLIVYTIISVVAYSMTTTTEFYILAILVATVQGGTQALSRSLYASMIPKHKASEFFGFYSVFDKVSGIFGPMIFSLIIVIAGSTRSAILSVIAFFVIGALILSRVKVAEGQRQAREAEEQLLPSPDVQPTTPA